MDIESEQFFVLTMLCFLEFDKQNGLFYAKGSYFLMKKRKKKKKRSKNIKWILFI